MFCFSCMATQAEYFLAFFCCETALDTQKAWRLPLDWGGEYSFTLFDML